MLYTSGSRRIYRELVGLVVLGETRVVPGLHILYFTIWPPASPRKGDGLTLYAPVSWIPRRSVYI
jgi:hypothetical protein